MQLNNPKNNVSNRIKQSESAKKRARRRLIGSIFMLFTALIILLNVTTKVKLIPVKPKVIEINNDAPARIKPAESASVPLVAASAPATLTNTPVDINQQPVVASVAESSTPIKEDTPRVDTLAHATKDEESSALETPPVVATTVRATPKIIIMNIDGAKPSPEAILNGTAATKTIYYVQIAASQNKSELRLLQKKLSKAHVKAFIQTGKGGMYRLRAGAFKTKEEAQLGLTQTQHGLDQ